MMGSNIKLGVTSSAVNGVIISWRELSKTRKELPGEYKYTGSNVTLLHRNQGALT